MPVTIQTALALPVVRRGVPEVVAGAQSLDRPVRWVHAAEVPNIASLLKGGELLLTTGLGMGRSDADQRRLVEELTARGVAGVFLELGSTFASIPAPLVAASTRVGLPLVALHRSVPFVDVTEAIHAVIVNLHFAVMQHGEELHLRFTDLLLQGSSIPDVLAAVADAVRNPVLLRRASGEVVAIASRGSRQADVSAAWDAVERGLPSATTALERPVPSGDPQRPGGSVVVLGLDAPIDDFSIVALERAVALVGLGLRHDRGERTVGRLERGAFLSDVLGNELSEADAVARGSALGLQADVLLPVAIGRREPRLGHLTEVEDAQWTRAWGDFRRTLDAHRIPALLGHVDGGTLLMVGLGSDRDRDDVAERIVELARVAIGHRVAGKDPSVFCVGAAAASWTAAAAAADRALRMLPAATAVCGRSWHDVTSPDLDLLFAALGEAPALQDFALAALEPVIAHDARRPAKLLPTLEAFCAHGGRKAETARALQLERRSLYHRLARLEALLGASLSDPETVLGLHIALRARRHRD